MIWWSSSTQDEPLFRNELDCPICNKPTIMRIAKSRKENWFMIIPWWSTTYYATCGVCWNSFELDKEVMEEILKEMKVREKEIV